MPGRAFKYKIELATVVINWDPQPGDPKAPSDYKVADQEAAFAKWRRSIKTWRIHVWNSALPVEEQVQLRLFPEIMPKPSRKT